MTASTYPHFQAATIDDLLNAIYRDLLANGEEVTATKGPNRERIGVILELENPRARLSRSETRGKLFSCLGEFCWYWSGTSDPAFIQYYIPWYAKLLEDGRLPGAYGPRLFNWAGKSQIEAVLGLLRKRPSSRQAVVQIFDRSDLDAKHEDVPCTCTLQFFVRNEQLHLVTHMRSNDAFLGLAHDVFSFTMMQEVVAIRLGVGLGSYRHLVGSLHLYERDVAEAKAFLDEGYQSTQQTMPPMPTERVEIGMSRLLEAESAIRLGAVLDEARTNDLHPYWADLVRLLQIFRAFRDDDHETASRIAELLDADFYRTFVQMRKG